MCLCQGIKRFGWFLVKWHVAMAAIPYFSFHFYSIRPASIFLVWNTITYWMDFLWIWFQLESKEKISNILKINPRQQLDPVSNKKEIHKYPPESINTRLIVNWNLLALRHLIKWINRNDIQHVEKGYAERFFVQKWKKKTGKI